MIGSVTDWVILIVVALVLFGGASRIPQLARAIGRATGEYQKAKTEVEREIRNMDVAPQQIAQTQPVSPQSSNHSSTPINAKIAQLEKELQELKKQSETPST
ncbi:MAG: twin-arginine translocase TatA/TatE family subunit [Candidatus Marsarchaeota archaeon]|nr:twin-arginine translocase TatA/TatE family subunit [Candidatus Marsarchaeota archaeon]